MSSYKKHVMFTALAAVRKGEGLFEVPPASMDEGEVWDTVNEVIDLYNNLAGILSELGMSAHATTLERAGQVVLCYRKAIFNEEEGEHNVH